MDPLFFATLNRFEVLNDLAEHWGGDRKRVVKRMLLASAINAIHMNVNVIPKPLH